MDLFNKRRKIKYDRVMSRINNQSRSTLKPKSYVTRHEIPSSVSLGAKPSISNVSFSVFSELPVVLNDYSPSADAPARRTFVVKPRKTLKSLDPVRSPHRTVSKAPPDIPVVQKVCNVKAGGSTPVLSSKNAWSNTHLRGCHSSRSHTRLKELKDEIKAYHETDKHIRLRSRLYQSCGVILNDFGQVASDKSVQVHIPETGYGNTAPLSNGSANSPLGRTAGSPPVTGAGGVGGATGAGPSPMAALMSVADTLPPGSPRSAGGSPPQPPQQRSNSRSSQHSPNSSGSNGGRRSSGSRHVSSTTSVSSTEAGDGADAAAPAPAPLLKCTLCQERLEDTHFVQCPSQPHHKFCFPCSRDSIKRQQQGSEVYCPSGEKCPLANSTVPWAFMQGEIATILGEEFKPKKERET